MSDYCPTYAHAAWRSNEERLRMRGWTVADNGCWEICGTRHRQGYGVIKVGGHDKYAHRLAYETWVGPIPDGLVVRHKCDNPPCINPEHLELGTVQDNVNDREERGRRTPARGSQQGSSKLKESDIPVIRARLKRGDTHKSIANDFGVSRTVIYCIKNNKTWRHVL